MVGEVQDAWVSGERRLVVAVGVVRVIAEHDEVVVGEHRGWAVKPRQVGVGDTQQMCDTHRVQDAATGGNRRGEVSIAVEVRQAKRRGGSAVLRRRRLG